MDWDGFAPTYSRQLFLERRAISRLLTMLDAQPNERFLDVGTGTAAVPALLARREVRPREVVGVDSSRAMLEHAPALPAGWRLEVADASELELADSSVDVVCASYLLHVLDPPRRRAVIGEIARVLRPGGRVGTLTPAPPSSSIGRAVTAPMIRRAQRSVGRSRGMLPLDPASDLAAASLAEVERARTYLGYPSLCVVARLTR